MRYTSDLTDAQWELIKEYFPTGSICALSLILLLYFTDFSLCGQTLIMEQLEKMGIADLHKKLPTQLSGRQQQRCAIARALAANSPVLLADEHTGVLDKKTGSEIMDCFKENSREKTIILITHDPETAAQCSKIVRIEDGVII